MFIIKETDHFFTLQTDFPLKPAEKHLNVHSD